MVGGGDGQGFNSQCYKGLVLTASAAAAVCISLLHLLPSSMAVGFKVRSQDLAKSCLLPEVPNYSMKAEGS